LDIIIEAGHVGSKFVEKSFGIMKAKVFKMNVCFGEKLPSSVDEFIHKLIILLSSSSGLSKAEVKLIVQQFLILQPVSARNAPVDVSEPYICTTVQNYWKLPTWMDSRANSRDYQLGDGYQDSTNPLVANSENL
jgi:hypothetical protein